MAGALDILGAFVVYRQSPPAAILRSVAAGLTGSRPGGAGLAAAGLALHFVIAFGAAAVFVMASRRWPALLRRPWLTGPLYGLAVFLVMQYVVIPLSAIGRFPGPWTATTLQVIALHLFVVGLPIALAARRWSAPPA